MLVGLALFKSHYLMYTTASSLEQFLNKMSELMENAIFIIPAISICFVILITSINVYIKIRRNFPVKVNCWFCNSNAKVPYDQFNSWMCLKCDQYNGFDQNGDYNCDIPAQRSLKLNKRWKTGVAQENCSFSELTTSTSRNGLCEACNRNQEIKVQQLASFEPKDTENFDNEIEHLREKLDKSYQLCSRCQRVLKRTLNRVANNVLGSKLAQIGAKGTKVFDRSMKIKISDTLSKKRAIVSRFILISLIILGALNLYELSGTIDLSKKHLDLYFPPYVTHAILLVISYIAAVKLVLIEYLTKIDIFSTDSTWFSHCSNFFYNNISIYLATDRDVFSNANSIMDTTAILLSASLLLLNRHKRSGSFLVLFLWSVKMLLPKMATTINSTVGGVVKILIAAATCIATVINYTSYEEHAPKKQSADNSFHRIYSDCDEDLSENSDEELSSSFGAFSTPRSEKCNSTIFNGSFNSMKSISPSALTTASLRNHKSSRSVMHSSPYTQSQDLLKHNKTSNELYFFPNKFIDPAKKYSSMASLNSSFRIADDCQTKLTGLNISGRNYVNNRTITCSSPAPSIVSVNRCRSPVLTPARLTFNQDYNNSTSMTAPLSQTSWVAGGFFVKNSMSPQKRQQPQSVDLPPILSRTQSSSSQSSGFESRTSSLNNGNGNGSRESSVAGDADRLSVFSEPTYFSDSVSHMGRARDPNSTFTFGQMHRPKVVFPVLSNTRSTFIGPTSYRDRSIKNHLIFPQTHENDARAYSQFGTQRGNGILSSTFSGSINSLHNSKSCFSHL